MTGGNIVLGESDIIIVQYYSKLYYIIQKLI